MNSKQAAAMVAMVFLAAGLPRSISLALGVIFAVLAIVWNILYGPAFL